VQTSCVELNLLLYSISCMCKNIWLVRHTSFVLLISTSAFEQTKQYCARYASVRYHWQWIILQVAASTLVAAAASASSAAVAPTAVAVAHTVLFVALTTFASDLLWSTRRFSYALLAFTQLVQYAHLCLHRLLLAVRVSQRPNAQHNVV
jgi:hypothetical protein